MTRYSVRSYDPADAEGLAEVWHASWHRAHADYVPAELSALRTIQEFRDRINKHCDNLILIGPIGQPLGVCFVREDELYQLFIAKDAQGTGVAAELINEGERQIKAAGFPIAMLDCVKENIRAQRFYIKQGWYPDGTTSANLETSEGPFELETLVFRKKL